ncbi:MAG: 30S ribosomal protein S16 [Acidobacteriota bacterium]
MLKIRLRRMGARNAPFYRVVVSDGRSTPTAAAVEEVGFYDPRRRPAEVNIDRERVEYWVSKGARMSDTVKSLMKRSTPEMAEAAPSA